MTDLHQRALRCLVAMQVAVLEHNDYRDVDVTLAIRALEQANREWQKLLRELQTV